jgi:hypothetical protein
MMRVLDLFSASGTLLKRLRAELRMAQPHQPSPEVDAFLRAQCAARRAETAEAVSLAG